MSNKKNGLSIEEQLKAERGQVTLCSNGDCCPIVDFDKEPGFVIITDDYNGVVKLTKQEYKMLRNK